MLTFTVFKLLCILSCSTRKPYSFQQLEKQMHIVDGALPHSPARARKVDLNTLINADRKLALTRLEGFFVVWLKGSRAEDSSRLLARALLLRKNELTRTATLAYMVSLVYSVVYS